MSNYFDNQDKWSWQVNDDGVKVFTDHGDHTHTVDVSKVPIGEMADNTGKTMGDAHRAASHDFKKTEDKQMSKASFNDRIKVDDATKAKLEQVSKEWSQQQQNNQKQSKNGNQDNGRERGDEGPGSQGRNADESIQETRLKASKTKQRYRRDFLCQTGNAEGSGAKELLSVLPNYEQEKITNTTDLSGHGDSPYQTHRHHHRGLGLRLSQSRTLETKPILTQEQLTDMQNSHITLIYNAEAAQTWTAKITR